MTISAHENNYDISSGRDFLHLAPRWIRALPRPMQAVNVWLDGAERRIFFRHFSNLGGELQSRCLLIGAASYCQYFRDRDTG